MKKILSTNTKAAAAEKPFEIVAPGPTRPRILKTGDQPGGAEIGDRDFVKAQATDAEIKALRGEIERRQAPAPNQPDVVLVCQNQKCRAWAAYQPKQAARSEGAECIHCNLGVRHDGGRLRLATPAETEMFWADKKRRDEIWKVRVRQQMEIERERSRLGLDRVGYLSIDADPSIKRNR